MNFCIGLRCLAVVVLLLGIVLACGGDDFGAAPAAIPASLPGEPGMPAAAPTPAAAMAMPASSAVQTAPEANTDASNSVSGSEVSFIQPLEFSRVQQSALAQNRVIVHTATMSLVVVDVARAMDGISALAGGLGGWVVNAERSAVSNGTIAVRVPAESLETAMARIAALGVREESRAITSQDVTEEFVDSQSRLAGMRATERRLLSFLDQAVTVEDALLVQEQLTLVQQDIERTQGRINALSQTAAFSLIEVSLRVAPITIGVDAGPDVSIRTGEPVRFKAEFQSVPGVEDFSFSWDFGDGSEASGEGTALTPSGARVTSTVSHAYSDDSGSPYIVTFTLSGGGDGGIVEGSDSLLVTVKRILPINLFAGENRTVEEGEEVAYSASFTRPEGLWDFAYRWDFGDGSATVQGAPEEGATRVTVNHTYEVYHPDPYPVAVTVSAMSEAGQVTATRRFAVFTTQRESFIVAGWEVVGVFKSAVRSLSAVVQAVTFVAIWLLVFSPVIVIVGGGLYLLLRYRPDWLLTPSARRRPSGRATGRAAPDNPAEGGPGNAA